MKSVSEIESICCLEIKMKIISPIHFHEWLGTAFPVLEGWGHEGGKDAIQVTSENKSEIIYFIFKPREVLFFKPTSCNKIKERPW